jgi:hypothetical protein
MPNLTCRTQRIECPAFVFALPVALFPDTCKGPMYGDGGSIILVGAPEFSTVVSETRATCS